MSNDGEPFAFTLEDAEADLLTGTEVVGSGGLQSLQRRLQAQLAEGRTVTFDNAELGQLIRYISQYGSGGFQGRLRKAFSRSLYDLLALEGKF